MIGKKNIAFGFIYLVFTASLGLVMVDKYEDFGKAAQEKQTSVGRLQALAGNDFEEELEPLNAMQIAKANTAGILGINKLNNTEAEIDAIKGGAHAHGNLESVLNIIVGLCLCFIAVASWLKQLISWLFIVGAVMHSGMLYLGTIFGFEWANTLLETGIGPFAILIGLLVMGFATIKGFSNKFIQDQ
ncbi:hypothetical protein JYT31_01515 [Beggiatoa alba]|nr:hypothetical protein [Beggiatoa alba]